MKMISFSLALLASLSSIAVENYTWQCTTINFLDGGLEAQDKKNIIYNLTIPTQNKTIVLSENSAVKISMRIFEIGNYFALQAIDKVSGKDLGWVEVDIDSKRVKFAPAKATKSGYSFVKCENLDYNKEKP